MYSRVLEADVRVVTVGDVASLFIEGGRVEAGVGVLE